MRVLLDTNVVLDLLLDREEFAEYAQEIFSLVERGKIEGFLCATTITTVFYLVNKYLSKAKSIEAIQTILEIFQVADVDKKVLLASLENSGKAYEDSVIYTSAYYTKVEYIVTRDLKGFKKSKVKTVTPKEFLKLIEKRENGHKHNRDL